MARLSFRCGEELVAAVDRERGRVPRERWLRDAVEAAVKGMGVEEWQAVKVDPVLGPEAERPGTSRWDDDGAHVEAHRVFDQSRRHAANCKCPVCS